MKSTAEVVICGAGIAGIAAAYHLAVRSGVKGVVLVDQGAPLALTSDKSTESYRNWWPGPGDAMVALMNHSIDILEGLARESGNFFRLNRRGYLYAIADPARVGLLRAAAEEAAALGAGLLREHAGRPGEAAYAPAPASGFEGQPAGSDLIVDPDLIRAHFPYLSPRTVAILHVRRAGWFSAQQLGMYLLERAREHGVRLVEGRVDGVETAGGSVAGIRVLQPGTTTTISTRTFVNAAGPMLKEVGAMLGADLPVFCEPHLKVAFRDSLEVVPRHAPMLIWADPQRLKWSEDERAALAESGDLSWLLDELPSGAHMRPEGEGGSPWLLLLWPYHARPMQPVWPVPVDPIYPEVVLRGLATMIPGLGAYFDRAPAPFVDGGYYTRTPENRPLVGPLPVGGAYLVGAMSGFGQMAACALGELLAAHVTGGSLPAYAPAFSLERYADPAYLRLLASRGDSWQL